jgi:hypothetical protein
MLHVHVNAAFHVKAAFHVNAAFYVNASCPCLCMSIYIYVEMPERQTVRHPVSPGSD